MIVINDFFKSLGMINELSSKFSKYENIVNPIQNLQSIMHNEVLGFASSSSIGMGSSIPAAINTMDLVGGFDFQPIISDSLKIWDSIKGIKFDSTLPNVMQTLSSLRESQFDSAFSAVIKVPDVSQTLAGQIARISAATPMGIGVQFDFLKNNYSFFDNQFSHVENVINQQLGLAQALESYNMLQSAIPQHIWDAVVPDFDSIHDKISDILQEDDISISDLGVDEIQFRQIKAETPDSASAVSVSQPVNWSQILQYVVDLITILAFILQLCSGQQDSQYKEEMLQMQRNQINIQQQQLQETQKTNELIENLTDIHQQLLQETKENKEHSIRQEQSLEEISGTLVKVLKFMEENSAPESMQ